MAITINCTFKNPKDCPYHENGNCDYFHGYTLNGRKDNAKTDKPICEMPMFYVKD